MCQGVDELSLACAVACSIRPMQVGTAVSCVVTFLTGRSVTVCGGASVNNAIELEDMDDAQ